METDWAALGATDEEFGGDWLVSKWIGEQLSVQHDKPFFLACGIYRLHEPRFVPKWPHVSITYYGTLQSGWRKPQNTGPGAVWLIMDANEKPLGHFVVGDRAARAVIPQK